MNDAGNRYGHFSDDGREFVITDPYTPRPWANVISNERMGLAVSQSGSGFCWIDNSQLAVITNWQQDFAQDTSGRFLYLRDAQSGDVWSLSPAPVWKDLDEFECRHGIGFTRFRGVRNHVASEWTLFVHPTATVELWLVRLRNESASAKHLELTSYLEWCCGVAPAPRREFHKLFIETALHASRRAITGQNHMWDVPSERFGHWNADFPYVAAFGTSQEIDAAEGEKSAFLGRYGSLRDPGALSQRTWSGTFGRHSDPIAALRSTIDLEPDEEKTIAFAIAVERSRDEALESVSRWTDPEAIAIALEDARRGWKDRLAEHRIETGNRELDAIVNDWARYQAISARLWGRCGYYQQSGAFGFRDQLQDSQVWLTIDPLRCRNQIRLHAEHQFADGSVYHWWHPLTERGLVTKMTDDLLWLGFVAANYVKETGDFTILEDRARFLDEGSGSIAEHVRRAFFRVFRRTSARGLPLIGAGDWNDGLSAAGLEDKGESIWLAHFLAGLLADWAEIHRRSGDETLEAGYPDRRRRLVDAINEHGWDGEWYWRATLDDGSKIGSASNRCGSIYLNAQTWAILNHVAPPDRAASAWAAVCDRLVTDAGALLLAPAYDSPVPEIGYITRYAPGLRENGGVYTHAATWAIAAAAKMKDHATLARLLRAIDPTNKDPERYHAEPYVLPGNVDGPQSPLFGRAGWTWYTGSAAWLHRVVSEWVLGVRPEWDGLRIDPCLPEGWSGARMSRNWRGATWEIVINTESHLSQTRVEIDGCLLDGNLIKPEQPGKRHVVRVTVGSQ